MKPSYRMGMGYDVHRLVSGRSLVLGGVEIPFPQGLAGHSDADVLSHAIGDALLGAATLGDLGRHFPDSDPRFKDISSLRLLAEICSMVHREGYQIANVDATLVAEQPKLAPYLGAMQTSLAEVLQVSPGQISIKATTTEGLGFAGRREGLAAYAVALLEKEA
jgi:2-C-methyl-D-erythritol 2,4-cyclodiphosphate synthase